MIEKARDILIVNGVKFPCPAVGMEIIQATMVDSARNANGTVVGQVIGRPIWKINNLQWVGLTQETWAEMKKALAPFYVPVTFTADDGTRHTVTMYPSDITGQPLFMDGLYYRNFRTCKFNLIDVGKPGEE